MDGHCRCRGRSPPGPLSHQLGRTLPTVSCQHRAWQRVANLCSWLAEGELKGSLFLRLAGSSDGGGQSFPLWRGAGEAGAH